MSDVAAPADRRFRRAHVKPARRRRRWTPWLGPLLVLGLAGLAAGYAVSRPAVLTAGALVLRVDRILVAGNQRLSNGEILAVLSGLKGESLLWTDLDRWRRRLLASPWVRDATLRRSLPSTIEVTVSERQPIGIGRLRDDMYLVDRSGAIIDQFGPQYADLDLPIIDGLAAPPPGGGGAIDGARAELAARALAELGTRPDIAGRLSQIDVTDSRNVAVILNGDPAVVRLGDDQFLARLQSYLELAPALRDRVPAIDYADVRFDHRIYVRPSGAAADAARASR